MKATLPNIRKLAGRGRTEDSANSGDINTNEIANNEAAEPKPPPSLPMFFMLSHLEEDGPVRLDGVKLAVLEVMGLELDEPKLGAFAGSLNALDFPVQLLVRQHPPVLQTLRNALAEAQPEDLPQQTREAAESLGRLLGTLESREGILDRRFYAVCEHARADELRGLLSRAGLGVFPLKGQPLKLLLLASALGGSPRRARRGGRTFSRGQPPRHPRRRPPDPLVAPGQVAPQPGPRLPPGPDGRRSADGPVGPPGGHSVGAGGPHPGVAEGPVRVGPVHVPEPGPQPVPRGGDRPGGREQTTGRGAAGKGAPVPRLTVGDAAR